MKIPFLRPPFTASERHVTNQILSGAEIGVGKKILEFESLFQDYIGCDTALSVCNGTIALDLVWDTFLRTGKLKKGDKVICPSFTFVAVPNSIVNAGLVPVFCDIDPETWNIRPTWDNIDISAIVAVHTFGNPCDIEHMMYLQEHGLVIVEDCAEACGAVYGNDRVGCFGDASIFSFAATKNLTTCEGGMVCFNGEDSEKHADTAHLIREHGYGYVTRNATLPGHNYRLDNLRSAIGIEQLKTLTGRNWRRKYIKTLIIDELKDAGLTYQKEPKDSVSSNQIFGVLVEEAKDRDPLFNYLVRAGIECKKYFDPPCHKQDYYGSAEFKIPHSNGADDTEMRNTQDISNRIICLPFDDKLTDREIMYMVDKIYEWEYG